MDPYRRGRLLRGMQWGDDTRTACRRPGIQDGPSEVRQTARVGNKEDSVTLENGTHLGHYRILALLGRGGMADVYRAEDERLGRKVALKAVPPEFARDPERVERFEQEVRAAARLSHANIVTVYEFGRGEDLHFYTMELMRGGDLKRRIRAHPEGMPPPEARAVAVAMARALDYAHRRGFVHRDVKPENILFDEDGTPQLTDFGIARAMGSGTRMTATGMSIGSPQYMSPEQARGLEVDGRSDLYSLGVALYEMLTGRLPFDAADALAVAYAHVNDPLPELPRELAAWQSVVDRLLAKSPEDRYGSARGLAEVLETDGLPRPPATRVMPVTREPGSTTRAMEATTRLVEPAKPSRGTLVAVGIRAGETVVFDRMEFVWVPAGEFRMGSTSRMAHDDEKPVTRVRISRGFWLGKYEVTQGQWESVMGSNPSRFKEYGRDCPVERVSWEDLQTFVRKLNENSEWRRYRLPTEAEWEYAARAGTEADTYAGDITRPLVNDPVLNRIAWYDENSGYRTHPVGRKAPNAWGLHDMLGNVWEWVGGWKGDYPGGTVTDPVGPRTDSYRVIRGGSWGNYARICRSADRIGGSPGTRNSDLGFRLLRTE